MIINTNLFNKIINLTNIVISFSGVTYNWARDYFPNLVEEDKRTFVSYDGNLYFSSLENIDRGNYLCNVQSSVSSTGRTGPTFPLAVVPHCNSVLFTFIK